MISNFGNRSRFKRYFGKYRAKVEDNEDPLFLGRIVAKVAVMPHVSLDWCMPCVPYAGAGVGFYAIPPIGANVWIEFEGGDMNYPIWSGCFWGEGEVPIVTEEPPNPLIKTLKTATAKIVVDDTPEIGGITISCGPPAVDGLLSMQFNSLGITISAPPALIKMIMEEGITLTYPPAVITMGEEGIVATMPPSVVSISEEAVSIEAPVINGTAEGEVSIEAGGAVSVEAGAEMSLSAGAALTVEAGAEASLTAGAAMEITGGVEMSLMAPLVNIN